ncbi:glycosyltransferase family 39 protein [Candidatus Altiarchaeota archaeon]
MSESITKHKNLLLGVLFLGLLLRLIIAWLPFEVLIEKVLVNDAFMGYAVVRNIVLGNGISFDGVNPTNGFHPLWIFVLTPIYYLFQYDHVLLTHIILTFSSVMNVVAGLVIYKILEHLRKPKAGFIALLIWLFNPLTIFIGLNGVETSLYALILSVTVWHYIILRRKGDEATLSDYLLLGILLSLTVFTRLDGILFLVAVLLDMLLLGKLKKKTPLNRVAVMIIASLFVFSPWIIWNMATFGTIFPTSLSLIEHKERSQLDETGILSTYFLKQQTRAVVNVFLRTLLLLPKVGLLFLVYYLIQNRRKLLEETEVFKPLVLFSIFLFAYYSFFLWHHSPRYFYPLLFTVTILIGVVFDSKRELMRIFLTLTLIEFLVFGLLFWSQGRAPIEKDRYDAYIWLENFKPGGEIVGTYNTVVYGFIHNKPQVNLDGRVNSEALDAIKNRQLYLYIKHENISYILDDEESIEMFEQFMGEDYDPNKFEVIHRRNNYAKWWGFRDWGDIIVLRVKS